MSKNGKCLCLCCVTLEFLDCVFTDLANFFLFSVRRMRTKFIDSGIVVYGLVFGMSTHDTCIRTDDAAIIFITSITTVW